MSAIAPRRPAPPRLPALAGAALLALGLSGSLAAQSSTNVDIFDVGPTAGGSEVVEREYGERVDSLVVATLELPKDRRLPHALRADSLAREMAALLPHSADAHQWRAVTAGLLAELTGTRDKIRYGREAYEQAVLAVELDPRHPGAHHVLGRIHAGVMRLGWLTRFVAGKMGLGEVLAGASWELAEHHLTRAVELDPAETTFRLGLALVLLERERPAQARPHLEALLRAPAATALARQHRERAGELLAGL